MNDVIKVMGNAAGEMSAASSRKEGRVYRIK